jgi:hypothetical protein
MNTDFFHQAKIEIGQEHSFLPRGLDVLFLTEKRRASPWL